MNNPDLDMREADEPRGLAGTNAHLRRLLDASTSKIMKLQGTADTTDQITDVKIGKSVEALQDAIQWWINSVERDLRKQNQDFRHIFHSITDHEIRSSEYRTIGLYDDASPGTDAEWMTWLGNLSTCIYVVLGRGIWAYLQTEIFSAIFPIGVDGELKSTFEDIFSIMRRGSIDQDSVTLANKWRSETITSLAKTENFQYRKTRQIRRLSTGLVDVLHMWIEADILETHYKSLHEKVVHEAVELHQKIACSSYEYLVATPESPDLIRGQVPHDSKLLAWTLKDIVKWRPPYGGIAGVFICLSPGIYRRGVPGEEHVAAAQPVVLVYDHLSPKTPRLPSRPIQAQSNYQQSQDVRKSPPRNPQKPPQRSPRRSPERHGQLDPPALPRVATTSRSATFPPSEEIITVTRGVRERHDSATLSSPTGFLGSFGRSLGIGSKETRAPAKEDNTRPALRSKTPPYSNRSKTPGSSQGSGRGGRKPKSRRHSIAESGSPPKFPTGSGIGEVPQQITPELLLLEAYEPEEASYDGYKDDRRRKDDDEVDSDAEFASDDGIIQNRVGVNELRNDPRRR